MGDAAPMIPVPRRPGSGAEPRTPVSVIICVYTMRRWDDALAAVEAARAQLTGDDEMVVVVDHNAELLERLTPELDGLDGLRVVGNSGPRGLSGARNTGVDLARNAIVVFLDDDAVARPGLIRTMAHAMRDEPVVAVGGAPEPAWPGGRRPWWFPPEFDWVVGCAYVGLPTERAEVRNVIGAAMAFRRSVLAEVGPFSTAVGRVGTLPLGCEETELCIRVRQRMPASVIYHLPDATVLHRVTRDRTTWRYFVRRCYSEGVSKALVARLVGPQDALSSERRYVSRTLPRLVGRSLLAFSRGRFVAAGPAAAVVCGLAATAAGYLRGSLAKRPPAESARHDLVAS
jgi:GT2 family glycosyltransferase